MSETNELIKYEGYYISLACTEKQGIEGRVLPKKSSSPRVGTKCLHSETITPSSGRANDFKAAPRIEEIIIQVVWKCQQWIDVQVKTEATIKKFAGKWRNR